MAVMALVASVAMVPELDGEIVDSEPWYLQFFFGKRSVFAVFAR